MIAEQRPDPRLVFDPRASGLAEPGRAFFRRNTVRVARDLVGAWISRRWRQEIEIEQDTIETLDAAEDPLTAEPGQRRHSDENADPATQI